MEGDAIPWHKEEQGKWQQHNIYEKVSPTVNGRADFSILLYLADKQSVRTCLRWRRQMAAIRRNTQYKLRSTQKRKAPEYGVKTYLLLMRLFFCARDTSSGFGGFSGKEIRRNTCLPVFCRTLDLFEQLVQRTFHHPDIILTDAGQGDTAGLGGHGHISGNNG